MNRIYLLDIARGIAAISVAIFHYKLFYSYNINTEEYIIENQPFYRYIRLIYQNGWIAVQFFFILSGFIFFKLYLKKIYQKKINFYEFLILRISRLYPLHLVTLIAVLLIYIALNSNNFHNPIQGDLKHFIYNLFLIQQWGISSFASFNEPAWSISVEILMYIIFFHVAIKQNKFFYTMLVIAISTIIFFKFKLIGYGGYCFFIGGLSFLIVDKLKLSNKIKITSLILIIFLSIMFLIILNTNTIIEKIILLTILFPSVINLLNLINNRYLQFGKEISILGDISYSIYLIHYPFILTVLFLLNVLDLKIDFNVPIIFLLYIAITFFISFYSYKFIEIPLKRILRNKYLKNDN